MLRAAGVADHPDPHRPRSRPACVFHLISRRQRSTPARFSRCTCLRPSRTLLTRPWLLGGVCWFSAVTPSGLPRQQRTPCPTPLGAIQSSLLDAGRLQALPRSVSPLTRYCNRRTPTLRRASSGRSACFRCSRLNGTSARLPVRPLRKRSAFNVPLEALLDQRPLSMSPFRRFSLTLDEGTLGGQAGWPSSSEGVDSAPRPPTAKTGPPGADRPSAPAYDRYTATPGANRIRLGGVTPAAASSTAWTTGIRHS